jgi:hypothetical protein
MNISRLHQVFQAMLGRGSSLAQAWHEVLRTARAPASAPEVHSPTSDDATPAHPVLHVVKNDTPAEPELPPHLYRDKDGVVCENSGGYHIVGGNAVRLERELGHTSVATANWRRSIEAAEHPREEQP